jgi:hypothetical protein
MAKQKPVTQAQQGIVSSVFNNFLASLRTDPAIDASIAERLRVVLLEDQALSADAIRKALFVDKKE